VNRLSAVVSRSRALHRRHVTERALARAVAAAPTPESVHELASLATHT
jgi:hypothetical protein